MNSNKKAIDKNLQEDSLTELQQNSKRAVQSVLWYTAGNILLKGIAFISTPIFTRLLSQSEFGAFNNISTWHALIAIFATLELSSALLRARIEFKDDIHSFMFSQLCLGNLVTLFLYGMVCLFMDHFVALTSVEPQYIHMMFICLLFSPAITFISTHLRFQYKYKHFAILSIGTSAATTIISVILVVLLEDKLFGRAAGHFIVHGLIGICCYILIARKGFRIKPTYWKYAINIAFPMTIHILSLYILSSSDKLMITRICGTEQTALYSLAYSCGVVLSFIWSSLNSAFSPLIGDSLSKRDFSITKKITLPYLGIYLVPAILLMLVSPELIYIMGGKNYAAARLAIPPVVAGSVMQYLYTLYVNVEQYEKKTWGVAVGTISAAVINIVLNALFIPIFGYIAAAYTTLACYSLLFAFHYLTVKKMRLNHCYNTRAVFAAALLAFLAAILSSILFYSIWIRYAVIVIYGIIVLIVLLKYKNLILSLIRGKVAL